jgi:site-specific DNA-methyltransferase (adenine-specific)
MNPDSAHKSNAWMDEVIAASQMKPYYSQDGIVLFNCDNRDILPKLGRFDLLLTDPNYGISVCNRSDGGVGSISSGSKNYGRMKWDLERAEQSVMDSMISMSEQAVIWGGNYFSFPPSSCWLIWDKAQRDFTFADGEMAWTNFARAVRIFTYSRGQLTAEGKVHPTQKPVPLMRWCLQLVPDAQTILDPFAGSGTTLLAAKLEGRRAVGIEINEDYCRIAATRLRQRVLDFSEAET